MRHDEKTVAQLHGGSGETNLRSLPRSIFQTGDRMAQSHPLCIQIEHANNPLEMMFRDGSHLKERNDHLFLGEVNPGIKLISSLALA